MTDEEKIAQAAETYCPDRNVKLPSGDILHVSHNAKTGFKAGVHWRDENPNPKVLGLVAAARRALHFGFVTTEKDGQLRNTCIELKEALAAWEKK